MVTLTLDKQTIEIPNDVPGESPILRRTPELMDSFVPGINNLYDLFYNGYKLSRDQPCLGERPILDRKTGERANHFEWQTYEQVAQRVDNFGSGLKHVLQQIGESRPKQVPIGIWSVNRPEWHLVDWACAAHSLFVVALYDTLGPDTVEYVVNHAEIQVVVCTKEHVVDLLKLRSKLPNLKAIISFDPLDKEESQALHAWAEEKDLLLVEFAQVEQQGKEKPVPHNPAQRTDLACIMYTSGTTGKSKGVMLTQGNFVAAVSGAIYNVKSSPADVGISYLPLGHIYGRVADAFTVAGGARLGFFSGKVDNLLEDMQILKPTLFNTVPRLLNRIYTGIVQSTLQAPGPKGALFRKAIATKLENLEQGKGTEHPVYDRLLFDKVRQVLGGRVRYINTGAAPLGKEVMQLLRVTLLADIRESYGATETNATCTMQIQGDPKPGCIGIPAPCNEMKLVDVPEMDYRTTDKPYARGEICVRGYNVSMGYYKEVEKTNEAFDKDGFYHTGDIGMIDERGTFMVIDRKKNIFKLSQGEYIAPEKIENIYARDILVSQIFVYGDSVQSCLVAIVVPDPLELGKLVQEKLPMLKSLSYQELCKSPEVHIAVLDRMTENGKRAEMRGFEFVKAIHLDSQPFTVENNLLTPSLKLKRPEARKFFQKEIEQLYQKIQDNASVSNTARL